MRDHGQDLGAALLEHIKGSLDREEAVGFVLFADSFEENWEVVMVVKLVNGHLPLHHVLHAVGESNGQVTAVVEATELTRGYITGTSCVGEWVSDRFLWLLFVEAEIFATNTDSFCQFLSSHRFVSGF